MTPDAPEEAHRACVAFLRALGAPTSRQLISHLGCYVARMVERYSFVEDSEKPPGMSTTAYWLQHMPDECDLMRDILRAKSTAERRRARQRTERSRSR